MHRFRLAVALLAAALTLSSLAEARPRYREPVPQYVVAESRFGHGTVSAPVRMTSKGPQVRLPGGTWIYCRRSCTETLRVESVDFWENVNGQTRMDNECGIFGCLRRGWAF
ncbi:MAG: hypothetical protein R3D27_10115 [Hyphomicrobiaceae bacterium]